MIEKRDYVKMRDKLLSVVEHICGGCTEPQVPGGNLGIDDPEKCPCRCERTRGILDSVKGLRILDEDD